MKRKQPPAPALPEGKAFTKGYTANPTGKGSPFGTPRMVEYRRKLTSAVSKKLTKAELIRCFEVLIDIRDDERAEKSERIAATKELLDRILGKSAVRAEVEINNTTTFEQRLVLSRVAATLIRDAGADVVEGEIAEPPQLPGPSDAESDAGTVIDGAEDVPG